MIIDIVKVQRTMIFSYLAMAKIFTLTFINQQIAPINTWVALISNKHYLRAVIHHNQRNQKFTP